jgi:molybdate transport system regulatory protein
MCKKCQMKAAKAEATNRSGYRVNGRIWIEKDGELFLGLGRVLLLEGIEKHGSIAAAARSMKLGYRTAWMWIDDMNRRALAPLVVKEIGGEKGGGSKLTGEGKKALSQFKRMRRKFYELAK